MVQGLEGLLPVHGFVLAGGKSSRMGEDKALLAFCGRSLVEIAVEKLRGFCAEVSIAGNREDLAAFARVVSETRLETGPGAGIEAGLRAAVCDWVLFTPVDVPLVPAELLRNWVEAMLGAEREHGGKVLGPLVCSYLRTGAQRQPTFCLLRRGVLPTVARQLDGGSRALSQIFGAIREEFGVTSIIEADAAAFSGEARVSAGELEAWFSNINTPEGFKEAKALARHLMGECE